MNLTVIDEATGGFEFNSGFGDFFVNFNLIIPSQALVYGPAILRFARTASFKFRLKALR